MSIGAEQNLQRGIYERLNAEASLVAHVGGRIFDYVPEATPFPYVEIGESTSVDWDSKTSSGQEHTLTVHVWSQAQGRSEVKRAMDLIRLALHNQAISVQDSETILARCEFSQVFKDPDGVTHHGVVRCRVITEII